MVTTPTTPAPRTVVVADGPVIIGAGLAGLTCAIELSPLRCIVLSAGAVSTGPKTVQ